MLFYRLQERLCSRVTSVFLKGMLTSRMVLRHSLLSWYVCMCVFVCENVCMCTCACMYVCIAAFTRAPGPESGFESGSQSTWERWSEAGFESSLLPCKRNQSGSGSGSECPCKRGLCMYICKYVLLYVRTYVVCFVY